MKLKLLVGSMVMIGLVSTYANAEVVRGVPNAGTTPTVVSTDLVLFWENIVDRNEDDASGVVLNKQNYVSGYVQTQASYSAKRGDTSYGVSPYQNIYDNNEGATSLALTGAEVYFDSQVNNWTRAHIATAYGSDFTNNGASDMFFTEAYAELNNFQQGAPVWLFAKVGRQYLNFTSTQWNVIVEPLTFDLGLSNATAVTVGAIASNGIYGDVYGYNGSPYGTNGSDTYLRTQNNIHGFGAEVGYAMTDAAQNLNVYADYIANMADSIGFNNSLYYGYNGGTKSEVYPEAQHPGLALHANYTTGPFTVIADYVTMLNKFNQTVYSFNGQGAQLAAYGVEGDYTFAAEKNQTVSLGYQGSQDAVQFYGLGNTFSMPKSRIFAGYKYAFAPNVALKFEYMNDQDYATSDVATTSTAGGKWAGSGSNNNTVLAQFKVMF